MKPKLTKELKEFSEKRLTTSGKTMFYTSIITSLFLLFIYLNATVFKMTFVLIGVFQELLTIPSIVAQPILLFLSLKQFIRIKFKVRSYAFYTLTVSLITTILAFGSLIIAKLPSVF
ncbi:hypothetical protein [Hwangdonia lutea]|uniref:Uncharacterized protein n=1 Tax=Hwangdonia lutea TaxID=3075823 RepID=A0AA97HS35_9FLAO|nr:hypothetical protein [Hwangdonia sp. SCSIO 19198]WOD44103.1 hypothetical protein RNZ46_02300 [Hwangdonia sp. SCSIO 19198]